MTPASKSQLVEDKMVDSPKIFDIDNAKSQVEMLNYLNDRFPLSQTHQLELKTLYRVSKMQLAFIDVTEENMAQMAKVKQMTSIIKREVFQSRSNSNNFSNMSIGSKF
jgi:hypothetical protein